MLQRIPLLTPKSHAITIRCHDCKTTATATLYPDGEELPKGWVGADAGWFRRVYSCPECNAKMMAKIENLLNIRR